MKPQQGTLPSPALSPWDSELNPQLLVCHQARDSFRGGRTARGPPGLGAVMPSGQAEMLMSRLVWENCSSLQGYWKYLVIQDPDSLAPSPLLR